MAAVNLSLSSEQAALLLPLLKQLSDMKPDNQVATSRGCEFQNSPPSSSPDAGHFASTSSDFTADELLHKKKRNKKSTSAQSFLLYVVREAAKTAGLWDRCPYMDDISPQALQRYYNHVYTMCPSLQHSEKELRRRLSDSLMNRRAHLRAKQVLTTSPRKKRKKAKMAEVFISDAVMVGVKAQDFSPGLEVEVRNASKTLIGVGLYLGNYDVDGPEQFGRVILTKRNECGDDTELYYPVQGKTNFGELQKDDVFVWKTKFLKKVEVSRKLTFDRHNNREESRVLQASSHNSSSEEVGLSSSTDCDSSDRDLLSKYELDRLERIQENQAVLRELLNSDAGKPESEAVSQSKGVSDVTKTKVSKKSKTLPRKPTKTPIKSKVVSQFTKPAKTPVTSKVVSKASKPSKSLIKAKSVPRTETSKQSKNIAESSAVKAKRSRFWEYVTEDEDEPDIFQSTILNGKRKRKPKQLMTV